MPNSNLSLLPQLFILPSALDHQASMTQLLALPPHTEITWLNQEKTSFKIETVRQLTQLASFSSYYHHQIRYFILLYFDSATIPAQNALLKLLEEPPVRTQFILTVSQLTNILPTIQSRCQIIHPDSSVIKADPLSANHLPPATIALTTWAKLEQLLRCSHGEIINFCSQFEDKTAATLFLHQLLTHLTPSQKTPQLHPYQIKILQQLLQAHQLLTQNFNLKLTLEETLFQSKRFLAN